MNPQYNEFYKTITNPIKYRLFMIFKLPMGFLSGLKLVALSPHIASVQVKYKYLNQNPFNSIYFAVLGMAAELSTGLLAFAQIHKRQPQISMLVVKNEAEFYKKAVGKIVFTCNDGQKVIDAIESTIATKQGIIVACESIGVNEQGETVAKFIFTWSFKAKS